MQAHHAAYLEASVALNSWLKLIERHGSLVHYLTASCAPIQHQHYPPGDFIDPETHTQCYFHSHGRQDEHGHLHIFGRVAPCQPTTHLVAVSLDAKGLPLSLFTVNQWVTSDKILPAEDTYGLLIGVSLASSGCDIYFHNWLVNFLRIYNQQILSILLERDRVLGIGTELEPILLGDKSLDVPSRLRIDWEADLGILDSLNLDNNRL